MLNSIKEAESKATLKRDSILTSQRTFSEEALLREEEYGAPDAGDDSEALGTSEPRFKEELKEENNCLCF